MNLSEKIKLARGKSGTPSYSSANQVLDILEGHKARDEEEAAGEDTRISGLQDKIIEMYNNRADRGEWLQLADVLGKGLSRVGMGVAGSKAGVDVSGVALPETPSYQSSNQDLDTLLKLASTKRQKPSPAGDLAELAYKQEFAGAEKQQALDKPDSRMKPQQSEWTTDKGQPLFFDPVKGKYVTSDTGEVYSGRVMRNTSSERQALEGVGITAANPEVAPEDFKPSRAQVRAFEKESTQLNTRLRDADSMLVAGQTVLESISRNDKLTPNFVMSMMPKLTGDVGNKSEWEQKMWSGSSYGPNMIQRILDKYTDRSQTLTSDDINLLRNNIQGSLQVIGNAKNTYVDQAAKRLESNENIPSAYTKKVIGAGLPGPGLPGAPEAKKDPEARKDPRYHGDQVEQDGVTYKWTGAGKSGYVPATPAAGAK